MTSSRKTDLADPAYALASYLDDLLHTATDAAKTVEVKAEDFGNDDTRDRAKKGADEGVNENVNVDDSTKHERSQQSHAGAGQNTATAGRTTPVSPVVDARTALQPERPPVIMPVSAPMEPEPVPVAQPVESPTLESPAKCPDDGEPAARPEWSERPFECLIFRVAGLQLAVPLILLGAIHRLEQDVKPLPGSPRWYMGILPDRSQTLRVVDSAEWIMAGRVPEGARDNYRFVIRLDNSEWALACDDVAQSFTLDPSEVRWRTSRSKRPWLAGTVISHMCALIDVGTMAQLLARAEREHHLRLE
ncbi:chemotaxis protein CheW [Marinobacter sp. SS21]|uniref:chemotaxis protein CheW n=1 Tax=Marinobacter sp. SS21 TaxID=2979460 RepID=UPI00232D7436|nr:chemotaxis protein CheW [Marinobacter sp. SS21]MDC0662142.1 chemotaxis protein CheW [Marinobacter sp. SS21]